MGNETKKLFSKVFEKIYLWAMESVFRSVIVLIVLIIFGIPLIAYLQEIVKNFPYIQIVQNLITFIKENFELFDYIYFPLFILIIIWLAFQYKEINKTKATSDSFKTDLNKWNFQSGSGWTIQKCTNAIGNMLSVTNSNYPGTLKSVYSWYDYDISFLAKIGKQNSDELQNLGVFVRSENNLNGVMLQITKTHVRPHLLYEGTYILDSEIQLPTVLKEEDWIKVRLIVKGNEIELWLFGHKILYKIPNEVINVDNNKLGRTIALKDARKSHDEIDKLQIKAINLYQESRSEASKDEKEKKFKEAKRIFDSIPAYTKIILEYQKGSVGFRQAGDEHSFYRNVVVKKCE